MNKDIEWVGGLHTFEQPGVNAPGTAKRITFLPAHKSAIFTLFAGESSNRSADGILSPSCCCLLCRDSMRVNENIEKKKGRKKLRREKKI